MRRKKYFLGAHTAMNSMAVSVMESGDTKLARLLPEWMSSKENLVSCKLE